MRGESLFGWRALTLGAVAAVAVVVAVGYGYAAITAADQVYTGCLQSGAISNVAVGTDPLKSCGKNAVQISWNQTGPQGQTGATGAPGATGETGATGAPGGVGSAACPATTLNGGTNDVVVNTDGRVYGRFVGQFAPFASPSPTTFTCAGSISGFEVTISGDVGGGLLQGYIVTLHVSGNNPTELECRFGTFGGPTALTCATTRTIDIEPGSQVYLVFNPEGGPVLRSFDWSADLAPPVAVYP